MSFAIEEVSGEGTEVLEEGTSLPLIRILQDQSPQLNKRKEQFLEGAEAGNLYSNVDQEVITSPLTIIPVGMNSLYVEWIPKDTGNGGWVANHPLSIVNDPRYEKGRGGKKYAEFLGDNELKYTSTWLCMALIDEEWKKVILALTSTQLRVARKWSNQIHKFRYTGDYKAVKPPIYAQTWELSTICEKNGADQEYFNYKLSNPKALDFETDEGLLNMARESAQDAKVGLPAPDPVAALPASDAEVEAESVF